jgi:intracellular sulfur oxidation DsrE/DsrF family protein
MKKVVIVITKPFLGHVEPEDKEFGLTMLDKFLHTLEKMPTIPYAICFYTEGVKLVCEGSPLLTGFQILQERGVKLVVCQSCLEYYHLREQLAAGEIGGMNDIVSQMLEADDVIYA